MELKKRILSAAILVTVLASGMYLGVKENQKELREKRAQDVRVEIEKVVAEASLGIDDDSMTFASIALLDRMYNEDPIQISDEAKAEAQRISLVEQLRSTRDALVAYNGYLRELTDSNIRLTKEDIAYLSSLDNFKYAGVAAIKSPNMDHYNIFYTGEDSQDYIKMEEGKVVLVTNFNEIRGNYFDDELYITQTRELTDDEAYGLIPIREVISNNNVDVSGYCFPEFGVVTPSDETLETIRKVYGEIVAECVKTFGLPVAYYDAKDLKDALSKQDIAVKGLNN